MTRLPTLLLASLAAALAATPATAQRIHPPTPAEIVAAAPASEWVEIAATDLLVMDLAPDAGGKPRRVVIQLVPPPFASGWVGNIRKLVAAHWWDGLSVNRVQDNYVAQWGDPDGEDKVKARPLPRGLMRMTAADYTVPRLLESPQQTVRRRGQSWWTRDPFAPDTAVVAGWPTARDAQRQWPVHCYGSVGVGRDLAPDTGSGAELYAVIGHAPRALDRVIAVVGRVIEGIAHLSALSRGTGDLGFYETAAERTPIVSIRLASELPDPPRFETLSSDSDSFAKLLEARANRSDAFFTAPAGGIDICASAAPVRRVPTSS
jgi:peptidylprolyl isomerase